MRLLQLSPLIMLFLLATAVMGQKNIYVGMEASIAYDIYELTDNGTELERPATGEGHWGISCSGDLNNYVFLEIGILRKYYDVGISFKNMNGASSSSAYDAWLFPLRLCTRINLSKDKIYLVPAIGYVFCINSDYGTTGGGSGSTKTNNDSASYNYTENLNLAQTFSLIQTGIGVEFPIFKTAIISFSTNYYTGFKKVIQLDINYSKNDSPTMTGKTYSKGEFWNICFSVKYPISNLWAKKS